MPKQQLDEYAELLLKEESLVCWLEFDVVDVGSLPVATSTNTVDGLSDNSCLSADAGQVVRQPPPSEARSGYALDIK